MFTKHPAYMLAMLTFATTTAVAQPKAPNVTRFVSVSAGSAHFCAVDVTGDIYCWGDGSWGQLGTGSTQSSTLVPVRIATLQRFRQVVAGATHTCALTADGYPYCWGSDQSGVMGDATVRESCTGSACSTQPNPVAIGFRFDSLAAGFEHTCGLTNGRAYCWGRDDAGQLGAAGPMSGCDGVACDRRPHLVSDSIRFSALSVRGNHSCGISSEMVYCWGSNAFGQLGGPASMGTSARPVRASAAHFSQIASAAMYTCGVTTTGDVECWGRNDQAQLGSPNLRATRATVVAPENDRFVRVSVGGMHSCALTSSGTVYCWGSNAANRLGGAPTGECNGVECSATPVRVTLPEKLTDVAVGGSMACAIGVEGTIYCWGGAASERAAIVALHSR